MGEYEKLDLNYICRVVTREGGVGYCILCLKCRNKTRGFKRIEATDKPCAECGAVYQSGSESSEGVTLEA